MAIMLLPAFAIFIYITSFGCHGCTFPSDLRGEWYSTKYGTLTFGDNTVSNFPVQTINQVLTFTCIESTGSQYVVSASDRFSQHIILYYYLCFDFTMLTTTKYLYLLNSNKVGNDGRIYVVASSTVPTMAEVCNVTDTRSPGEYLLLVKKDEVSSAVEACPVDVQSIFDVTMSTASVQDCNGTTLDGQTTGQLVFNYSTCATGMFSSTGLLQCLYHTTADDGYTYVTLYNNETNPDGVNMYRFTCMVFSKSKDTLNATEYPDICHTLQTPVSVNAPGITYVMTDTLYTEPTTTTATPTESSNSTTLIIVLVVIIVFIIIIIAVIVVYIIYRLHCQKQPTEEPRERKRKRKTSITDYTTGIKRRTSRDENDDVASQKIPMEIVHQIENGIKLDYPKEKWQRKWERSPRKHKTSKEDLTTETEVELDKPYTASTSLPESLDHPVDRTEMPTNTSKQQRPPKTTNSISDTTPTVRTPRAPPSPKIPESTGKYASPRQPSLESVFEPTHVKEQRLETIIENPLSRPTTRESNRAGSVKKLREHPTLVLPGLTNEPKSSVTSHSTASIGGISLRHSIQNSKGSSYGGSSVSIFDDPTWLFENNTTSPDRVFQLMRNIQPTFKPHKKKDTKWFTNTHAKPQNRTDVELNSLRTSHNTGSGLRVPWSVNRSQSLQIIQQERRQGSARGQRKPIRFSATTRIVKPVSEDGKS